MFNTRKGKQSARKYYSHPNNQEKTKLICATNDQLYAVVLSRSNNYMLNVMCSDSKSRLVKIPGKFKNRVMIAIGDTLLLTPDSNNTELFTISHKYSTQQAEMLRQQGVVAITSVKPVAKPLKKHKKKHK